MKRSSRFRSLNTLVPVVTFAYFDLNFVLIALASLVTSGTIPDFIFFNIPFMIIALLAAIGVWRQYRVGYIGSAALTGFFLFGFSVINWDHGLGVLAYPANTGEFFFIATLFPLIAASFIYSLLGLRKVWRGRAVIVAATDVPRTIPRSGVVVLLSLGFIVGALVVGLLAGPVEQKLLNIPTSADITIVSGAASQSNPKFFDPVTFQAKVGQTITWVNRDSQTHTITSDTNLFDSGVKGPGDTYTYTFKQPGTYTYHCSLHPWMKATVVVTG